MQYHRRNWRNHIKYSWFCHQPTLWYRDWQYIGSTKIWTVISESVLSLFYHGASQLSGSYIPKSLSYDKWYQMQHYGMPTRLLDWTLHTSFGCSLFQIGEDDKYDNVDARLMSNSAFKLLYLSNRFKYCIRNVKTCVLWEISNHLACYATSNDFVNMLNTHVLHTWHLVLTEKVRWRQNLSHTLLIPKRKGILKNVMIRYKRKLLFWYYSCRSRINQQDIYTNNYRD